MKTLLISLLLIFSSMTFTLAGEGRYQVAQANNTYYIVIDTKTGKTKICTLNGYEDAPSCTPWTNG